MTQDEFDKFSWGAGLKARYDGEIYTVASVDFFERLIGLSELRAKLPTADDIRWCRCENVEVLND